MHVPQEAFIPMIWWWNVIHLFENTMHDMQNDMMKCMFMSQETLICMRCDDIKILCMIVP